MAAQIRLYTLASSIALIAGCTSVNTPLNDVDLNYRYRAPNTTRAALLAARPEPVGRSNPGESATAIRADPSEAASPTRGSGTAPSPNDTDGYFVGIAISGGGSRSANFAAACMFELQRFGLLQRADYISSVSGGSLTAAYYCLNDRDWNPGAVQRRLTHAFASDVIVQTLIPWNWVALTFSNWDRSDMLADSFNRNLFSDHGRPQTFGDLRPDRPRLLINATDLQSGRPFVFCNETFDDLNSDLSKFPMGSAVAASSAVPVLLHHVTLRDFSTNFAQYRHLIDGGVSDNLGVQTLIETYTAQVASAAQRGDADPYPGGAVLFVLDARTSFDAQLSDKGDISFVESLSIGAGLTSTALLNRASSATLSELVVKNADDNTTAKRLREQIADLERSGYLILDGHNGRPVRVVHLALSHMREVTSVPFASFNERVNSIATYFNIDDTEAFHLYQAAKLLVKEKFEPKLQQLSEELARPAPMAASRPSTTTQTSSSP